MKRQFLWLIFGAGMVITVPLRLYQLFFQLDAQGFYADGGIVSAILVGVLFACMAALLLGSYPSRHLPKRFTQQRDIPSGIAQTGLGVVSVLYSIQRIFEIGSGGGAQGLTGGLLYIALILSFFGIGAGIVWIVQGVSCFVKKNLLRLATLAGILPPIWMAILLFSQAVQFSGSSVALNNTETVYQTMTMVLMTLFAFNHSKMIAGAQGKKCGRRVYGYGLSMTLFGVTAALPSLVAAVTGTSDAGALGLWMSILVLVLSLTAVVFLITLPRGKDAFVEELVEEKAEETKKKPAKAKNATPNPADKASPKTAKHPQTEEIEDEPEAEQPQGSKFLRAILYILGGFNKVGEKIGKLLRGKRERVPFEPGELDEKPTMQIDQSWRLDFYGMIEDTDENQPYRPEIHTLTPEQVAKQEARRAEVLAMLEAEMDADKQEEELRIPQWRKKRKEQKARYENRYKKKK